MRKLDVVDNRTPRELVADGDHRWPARMVAGYPAGDDTGPGPIYLPPHLSGFKRRRFLRSLLLAEPEAPQKAAERRLNFASTRGDVVCPECGEKSYDHPPDPEEPSLTILCDRSRVKL